MPIVAPEAVRQHLTRGQPHPVYLLVGDDERGIDELVEAFTGLVDEEVRALNVQRFHAGDRPEEAERAAVAAARTVPMLGERRVVILWRAERLLGAKGRRGAGADDEEGGDRGRGGEALLAYLEAPAPHATLVLVAAEVNRTLKLAKALYARAAVVECLGLKEGREVKSWQLEGIGRKAERWAEQKLAEAGKRLDRDGLAVLAERAGADLGRLRADVERLLLYAGPRTRLTRQDVEAVVGPAVAQDAWAVASALDQGRAADALRELAHLLDAGVSPFLLLGQLAWVARDRLVPARPDRARRVMDALLRTDLDLKSSAGDPRVLLERLVVELCEPPSPRSRRGHEERRLRPR